MSVKKDILDQLNALIDEGKRCEASFRMVDMGANESSMPETDLRAFETKSFAAIERIVGKQSEYYRSLPSNDDPQPISVPGYTPTFIPAVNGALAATRFL